jgi:hypothetical protein
MKMIVAGVAIALAAAPPAFAKAKARHGHVHAAQAVHAQPRSWDAQPVRSAHSPNPQWDVYRGGHYVGSDPDPHVRSMMRLDNPSRGD